MNIGGDTLWIIGGLLGGGILYSVFLDPPLRRLIGKMFGVTVVVRGGKDIYVEGTHQGKGFLISVLYLLIIVGLFLVWMAIVFALAIILLNMADFIQRVS